MAYWIKDAYAATDQKASTEFKAGSRKRVRSDGIGDGIIRVQVLDERLLLRRKEQNYLRRPKLLATIYDSSDPVLHWRGI